VFSVVFGAGMKKRKVTPALSEIIVYHDGHIKNVTA
jgi:hypothetical protein